MTKPYSSINKSTKKPDTLSKGEVEKVSDNYLLVMKKLILSKFSKGSSFCLMKEKDISVLF
jgi:hypothetical protein